MIRRLGRPLAHGAWTADWFAGQVDLVSLFGPPTSLAAARERAERLNAPADWTRAIRGNDQDPVPSNAVIVLAGQQPVLGGGPLLVAHKAATAIALARALEPELGRPVIPVFLLATQDHDSTEVDHIDFIDTSKNRMSRTRCELRPSHEMFHRASWDPAGFEAFKEHFKTIRNAFKVRLDPDRAPEHVARLIESTLGTQGLRIVEAHNLETAGRPLLERAIRDPALLANQLREGAAALAHASLRSSFDPEDPRPLVLESAGGRRRRLDPEDPNALERLARQPEDFSPHAALRPIVQAAALPVVAQVCGPSEILYLAQARGLHDVFEVTAPLLVPRLEATRVRATDHEQDVIDVITGARRTLLESAANDAIEAAERFATAVEGEDPGLRRRLDRFLGKTRRDVDRLAQAPIWRGGGSEALMRFRPRGRLQDTVLAWLPDALEAPSPQAWSSQLVELCQPLQPPEHVLYSYPTTAGNS